MASLRLESSTDTLDLDEQWANDGYGFQSHAGAMGFGLPDADVQWFEGAGDGAIFRGRRVSSREIDLPISIRTHTRAELEVALDRLTTLLTSPCRLVRTDDQGYTWILEVVHAGGGDYVTGEDTDGENELHLTLQLHSGWSAWRRGESEFFSLSPAPGGDEHPYGTLAINNPGPAPAWPVYVVQGPFSTFEVRNEKGEGFRLAAGVAAGGYVTIDTGAGTVVSTPPSGGSSFNAYGLLDPNPRFFTLCPGANTLTVTMTGGATGPGASVLVKASTSPRRTNRFPNPALSLTSGTTTVRSNLCPAPTGAVTTGWYSTGNGTRFISSITSTTVPPVPGADGSYVRMKVNSTPAAGARAKFWAPPAAHSGLMMVSAYVKTSSLVKKVTPVLHCTSGSTFDATTEEDREGEVVLTPGTGVVRVSMVGHFLTGTHVRLGILADGLLVNDAIDMTKVLYEPVPELRDYFDGSIGTTLTGTSRAWSGTAGSSASVMTGPTATGWTGVNFAKCWVAGSTIYALGCGDSGRLVGPTGTGTTHTLGTPWSGSIKASKTGGVGQQPSGQVALSIIPSNSYVPIVRSNTVTAVETYWTTVRTSVGGTQPPAGTPGVRPMIEMYQTGEHRFTDLLMERTATPGPFFSGSTTNSISSGMHEWQGTVQNSVSQEFVAKWERASFTSVSYQPRRWAVI